MNICVVYFSRTGNTKRLAQAIGHATNAEIFDIAQISPDALSNFDLLIFGTPVEGASPSKEAVSFVANMVPVENKKVIIFCTYRLFGNDRTLKAIEKLLSGKGYQTVSKLSKKGMKPTAPAEFTKIIAEVKGVIEKLT